MTDQRRPGAPGAPPPAASPDEKRVPIGVIRGAHGLRGWVRMQVYGDGGDALAPGAQLTLSSPETGHRMFEVRQVTSGRKAGEVRAVFEGVATREAAEALYGCNVSVPAAELGPAEEGEYWAHDLVGCRMTSEEGRVVGEIRGVWETGASDVIVVEGEGGREHLVPAALLRDVDLDARAVVVELLPGLIEDD